MSPPQAGRAALTSLGKFSLLGHLPFHNPLRLGSEGAAAQPHTGSGRPLRPPFPRGPPPRRDGGTHPPSAGGTAP